MNNASMIPLCLLLALMAPFVLGYWAGRTDERRKQFYDQLKRDFQRRCQPKEPLARYSKQYQELTRS